MEAKDKKTRYSRYKNVTYNKRIKTWDISLTRGGRRVCKSFKTEREAALAVDKWLLNHGYEPVNILIKK